MVATAPPALPPPLFTPGMKLPEADQVIFTIQNRAPWSGREGDPRPDRMARGYVVFAHADGSQFEIGACCGGDPAATPLAPS